MSSRCCKSLPRCATCPVVLAARARGRFGLDTENALVSEIMTGAPPRTLPDCVEAALTALDDRRVAPAQVAAP
jgi:hypothetical protein